ncbi:hypothetical protein ColKHC_02575 [Colletotrichum higginsianum]|nr:hypothetical protein ColKHC_02575 [Colletotrichum higginsianum]
MPSVRLATPPSPIFACHPDDRTVDLDRAVDLDRFVDATDALNRSVFEKDLLGGRPCGSGAIAAGSMGSFGAIFGSNFVSKIAESVGI